MQVSNAIVSHATYSLATNECPRFFSLKGATVRPSIGSRTVYYYIILTSAALQALCNERPRLLPVGHEVVADALHAGGVQGAEVLIGVVYVSENNGLCLPISDYRLSFFSTLLQQGCVNENTSLP